MISKFGLWKMGKGNDDAVGFIKTSTSVVFDRPNSNSERYNPSYGNFHSNVMCVSSFRQKTNIWTSHSESERDIHKWWVIKYGKIKTKAHSKPFPFPIIYLMRILKMVHKILFIRVFIGFIYFQFSFFICTVDVEYVAYNCSLFFALSFSSLSHELTHISSKSLRVILYRCNTSSTDE